VLDTSNNTIVATIPLAAGAVPNGVAVSADGTRAYVADLGTSSVVVIDTATNTQIATFTDVGLGLDRVALTPDGNHLYVTASASASVTVLDAFTGATIATVPVGISPYGVAMRPDGAVAYVTNAVSGTVSVIDTATNTVVATVDVGDGPTRVTFSGDGSRAYVTNSDDTTVSVIDTATHTEIDTIEVNVGTSRPHGSALSPDGSVLYVNVTSGTLEVIEVATGNTLASLAMDVDPLEVVVSPDGTHAYVVHRSGGTLAVIDFAGVSPL
jgi:YVTN family beta-propeller protein